MISFYKHDGRAVIVNNFAELPTILDSLWGSDLSYIFSDDRVFNEAVADAYTDPASGAILIPVAFEGRVMKRSQVWAGPYAVMALSIMRDRMTPHTKSASTRQNDLDADTRFMLAKNGFVDDKAQVECKQILVDLLRNCGYGQLAENFDRSFHLRVRYDYKFDPHP